jgi:hypothetical protein
MKGRKAKQESRAMEFRQRLMVLEGDARIFKAIAPVACARTEHHSSTVIALPDGPGRVAGLGALPRR